MIVIFSVFKANLKWQITTQQKISVFQLNNVVNVVAFCMNSLHLWARRLSIKMCLAKGLWRMLICLKRSHVDNAAQRNSWFSVFKTIWFASRRVCCQIQIPKRILNEDGIHVEMLKSTTSFNFRGISVHCCRQCAYSKMWALCFLLCRCLSFRMNTWRLSRPTLVLKWGINGYE